MKLEGKTAVITGAGRGIGRAIALSLAKEGANIVVAARSVDEIEAVTEEVRASGRQAIAVPVDVRSKAQVEALANAAFDRFGSVEILVNNSGVGVHNAIPEITEADWDLTIDVNLKGTFLCTQAFFEHMCDNGQGHIVNVISRSAKVGLAKLGAYAASKFGALGFTQTTDQEGIAFGVKATAVLPGAVDTKGRADNHDDQDHSALLQPEDVADYVTFILTRPDRVYIAESSIGAQFLKPIPTNSISLKSGI